MHAMRVSLGIDIIKASHIDIAAGFRGCSWRNGWQILDRLLADVADIVTLDVCPFHSTAVVPQCKVPTALAFQLDCLSSLKHFQ